MGYETFESVKKEIAKAQEIIIDNDCEKFFYKMSLVELKIIWFIRKEKYHVRIYAHQVCNFLTIVFCFYC